MSVDWYEGSAYRAGWVLYIALLVPTFVLNLLTFLLISLSPRLNASASSLIVRYLAAEDGLFALFCLVQCAVNISSDMMAGEMLGCSLQANYLLFFVLCTGYTICCIAYNNEQKIKFKTGLSSTQVLCVHASIWAWCALVAVLGCVVAAPARLVPSGTFCAPALEQRDPALVCYLMGAAGVSFFLLHRYYLMWSHVRHHTEELLSQYSAQRVEAQARQVRLAKRMLLIIGTYFFCYLPEFVVTFWEAANTAASPELHIACACLIHLNSLLNPVLYFFMNQNMRLAAKDLLCRHSTRVSPVSPVSPTSPRSKSPAAQGKQSAKVEPAAPNPPAADGQDAITISV
jgi:hypothetical protein